MELRKDGHVFHHRAQTTNQPRQVLHDILVLRRVTENACTVCEVAHQRQDEKQK